jgi:hypothetical protein
VVEQPSVFGAVNKTQISSSSIPKCSNLTEFPVISFIYDSSCRPRQFPSERLEKTEEYVGRGGVRESQNFLSDESVQFGRIGHDRDAS